MKTKLLVLLLTLCAVIALAPVTTLAATADFTDVNADAWYADEIQYVSEKGLMDGVGSNEFAPEGTVTRAMAWATIARMDGVTPVEGETWWHAGQQWAIEKGISDGTMTEENITREQLVTMLWRYAKYMNYDVSVGEETNILSYADAFDINEWAIPAMQWACGAGVINGMGDSLQPQGELTRAQLATILYRLNEEVIPAAPAEPDIPVVPENPDASDAHTITFMWNYDDKGIYKTVEIEDGDTAGALAVPSRSGYLFGGWFTEGGVHLTMNTEITEDMVVYAKWYVDYPSAPHKHSFASEWSFDATNHWKAADCGHAVTASEEAHDIAEGKCSVCGIYVATNTEELQAAINAVPAGGTVYVAAGDYDAVDFRSPSTSNDSVTILGEDGANVARIFISVHERVAPVNLTVKNITFDEIGFGSNDIDVTGLTIEDCTFINGATISLANNPITDTTVRNCTFSGKRVVQSNYATPVYIHGPADGLIVEDCTFTDVGYNAIQLANTIDGNIEIRNNIINGTVDRILRFGSIQENARVIIRDNEITGNGDNGQMIKATTIADGAAITLSGNKWNEYKDEALSHGGGIWRLPVVVADTAAKAQAALDSATPGMTLKLAEGVNYGTLYLRPYKNSPATKVVDWVGNDYRWETYTCFEDLTILGATGAIVDAIVIEGGTYYNTTHSQSGTYPIMLSLVELKDVTIEGVTFTGNGGTDPQGHGNAINLSGCNIKVDGLTLKKCVLEDELDNARLIYKTEATNTVHNYTYDGNDYTFSPTLANITVTECIFNGGYMGMELRETHNLTITKNTFNAVTSRDMLLPTNSDGHSYSGTITISGNTSTGAGERFLRMSGIDCNAITSVTITNNTYFSEVTGLDKDVVKIDDIRHYDATKFNISGNNWNGGIVNINGNLMLYDVKGLESFRALVNTEGKTLEGKTVSLMADVDLGDSAWTPIGSQAHPFGGTFEGNGHTISNLNVEGTNDVGFFGHTYGTVQNLTIENAKVTGSAHVGAISGRAYTGSVTNCHVTGTIKISGHYKVGGITGGDYAKLSNCSVIGDSSSYIMGIHKANELEGDNIGGIMGFHAEVNSLDVPVIENCTASIHVEGTRKVGGIVGSIGNRVTVDNCTYSGAVNTNASSEYASANSSKLFVGGIVGEAAHAGEVTINKCTVASGSTISGYEGLVGDFCGGKRNITTINIKECTSSGTVVFI